MNPNGSSAMRLMTWLGTITLAFFAAGCGGEAPTAPSSPGSAATQPAESLTVVDIDDLQRIRQETAAADQILVIDFWATWCEPCKAMFPGLKRALNAHGERVRKISVTLDTPGKYEQAAIAFLREHDALHDAYLMNPDADEQLRMPQAMGEQWNDLVVPAILVYDAEGNLAGEFFGGHVEPIAERVQQLIDARS